MTIATLDIVPILLFVEGLEIVHPKHIKSICHLLSFRKVNLLIYSRATARLWILLRGSSRAAQRTGREFSCLKLSGRQCERELEVVCSDPKKRD